MWSIKRVLFSKAATKKKRRDYARQVKCQLRMEWKDPVERFLELLRLRTVSSEGPSGSYEEVRRAGIGCGVREGLTRDWVFFIWLEW